jgi:NarL family two-component system response regulator LiaR
MHHFLARTRRHPARDEKEAHGSVDSRPFAPAQQVQNGAVRVLIADGDVLARNAIRDALCDAGLFVVGQASDASHAIDLAGRCCADVVLLDATLPPDGAFDAMEAIAAVRPDTRIVILSRSDGGAEGLRALARGASGYLSRDMELGSLARAIEGVMAGEGAISRAMAASLIQHVRQLSSSLRGMRPVKSPLTTREWEVMDLLSAGSSTAQIAKTLVVSPETIDSHVQHIMRKLHAHSRSEAIEIAERSRLLANGSG